MQCIFGFIAVVETWLPTWTIQTLTDLQSVFVFHAVRVIWSHIQDEHDTPGL